MVAIGAFAICVVLIIVFIYWPTSRYVTASVDRLIVDRANTFSSLPPQQRLQALQQHLDGDPRRVKLGGLFDAHGNRVIGNIESLPRNLQPDTPPQQLLVVRIDAAGREQQLARAVARKLDDGGILLIGRNTDELSEIGSTIERAVAWGLIPSLCLGSLFGAFLSIRTQQRLDQYNRQIQRIVAGELRERLPEQGGAPFTELARLINAMLDEMEELLRSVAGVGDDIAHDLRTPLTNVRMTLESGRHKAKTLDELKAAVDRAIGGLDQSLTMVTALLRITEIEHSRRLEGFREVDLAELVRDVGELYEPMAKDKGVTLVVEAKEKMVVQGDRDLLFEAIANLVDNAVKFTPECGHIELKLYRIGERSIVHVSDTGRGIAPSERDLVTRRFYRSDKSRGEPGVGLGLSLVVAIAKLHGVQFGLSPAPTGRGCVAEIVFERVPPQVS
ncbi:HAMP domain-containing protein [Bradyrhizobium hipponense]|uniref:histidine kinase n=1 Tax=Bradyrhizobium hipponense TaxID=2605638 RepID=A0A5S4YTI3_9BRAD|nr:ATP-binding protein [Bradyrhizobium hipponense]TYO67438.1 HAMP domain-containing protein [Bradyrhizobium hipponense]